MKNWKVVAGMALLASLALTGCGGGGGSIQSPSASEYRMITVSNTGTIALYSVTSGGSLSEIGSMNTAGQFVSVAAMENRAYMSSSNSDGIVRLDFANDLPGNLVAAGLAGDSGSLLFKHPTKAMLYGLVPTQNKIDQYVINNNGTLVPQAQANADLKPVDMVFHPNGNYAYVVSRDSKVIRAYTVSANGALVFIPGAAYPTTINPTKVVISDDGAYIYAMGEDQDIAQFSIGVNGLLTALAPLKVNYPMGNFRAAITANNVLSFYRESDEGIETFGRTGNGLLANLGVANYATNAITDVYRLPGQNLLLLLAKSSGSGQTVSMGSNGVGAFQSGATLQTGIVDVAFWEVP